MADYIACVEVSGGNKQEITEEVQRTKGSKAGGAASGSGSGLVIKGQGGVVVDRNAEESIARRLQQRWYSSAMAECRKVLQLPEPKARSGSRPGKRDGDKRSDAWPEVEFESQPLYGTGYEKMLALIDSTTLGTFDPREGRSFRITAGEHTVSVQMTGQSIIPSLLPAAIDQAIDRAAMSLTRSNEIKFVALPGAHIRLAMSPAPDRWKGALVLARRP